MVADLRLSTSPAAAARAVLPLAAHLEVRRAASEAHQDALTSARDALRSSAIYTTIEGEVGPEHADSVTVLLFAMADHLTPSQRNALGTVSGTVADDLRNVHAQLTALLAIRSG